MRWRDLDTAMSSKKDEVTESQLERLHRDECMVQIYDFELIRFMVECLCDGWRRSNIATVNN